VKFNPMYLTKEEESILAGDNGEMLSKLLRLLVELGDSYGADKLIEIKSAHTVLNIGLRFVTAAAKILRDVAEAGLKVKVRTTADPIIDMHYEEELGAATALYQLQDQLEADLKKIGVHGFTCTPYFLDNKPNKGDHCAWSESSAVIYLNSVIGARSNREGGVVDIASAITGKTPNMGLHLTENRKGGILYKIKVDDYNLLDLTSMGLKIGETAGSVIPVIEGLPNISFDELKNLGAASAASGAVALIHVLGVTPEAQTMEDAFQGDSPKDTIVITQDDLAEMEEKYSTEWDDPPVNIGIGCPHLSETEVKEVLNRIKGKKVLEGVNFWLCMCPDVIDTIRNSEYNEIVQNSGVKLAYHCPMLVPAPRPYTTNSAKSCVYVNASYRNIEECIKLATEGR